MFATVCLPRSPTHKMLHWLHLHMYESDVPAASRALANDRMRAPCVLDDTVRTVTQRRTASCLLSVRRCVICTSSSLSICSHECLIDVAIEHVGRSGRWNELVARDGKGCRE